MKLLLYCTKAKPYLMNLNTKYFISSDRESLRYIDKQDMKDYNLNGKIVAECDFEVEEIYLKETYIEAWLETKTLSEEQLREKSCLRLDELYHYLNEDKGYAIHIKNLHIFDKPRELSECWKNTNAWIFSNEKLYKAPQNMQYCGDWNLKKAILISIRPEWLCKILNGKKTIEIRKKVLKEMLGNETR